MTKTFTAGVFYTISEVAGMVRLSKQTIYRLIESGKFPKPVYLSERTPRWSAGQIQAWLESKEKENE